jgi:hypothetical protein
MKTHIQFALLILITLTFKMFSTAQNISIIPEPVRLEPKRGNFTFAGDLEILVPAGDYGMRQNAEFLKNYLNNIPGTNIQVREFSGINQIPARGIILTLNPFWGRAERYTMDILPGESWYPVMIMQVSFMVFKHYGNYYPLNLKMLIKHLN